MSDTLTLVRQAAAHAILVLPHAEAQMDAETPRVTRDEVRQVVLTGEIIEDYPEDPRGHSCLLLGRGQGHRALHVVCSPKNTYLAIITVYVPNPTWWEADWRTRRR